MALPTSVIRAFAAVAAIVAVAVVVVASRIPKPTVRVAATGPGPGDSLAKLARTMLTDSNPRAIAQALVCEQRRLLDVYGPSKGEVIAREVFETVYTDADRERRRQVDRKLANNMFTLDCGRRHGADSTH